jgi:hypothetical protein
MDYRYLLISDEKRLSAKGLSCSVFESQQLIDIKRLIRSRAGGSDAAWHSAQARAGQTGTFAYVWLDYAMIRSLPRWCCFW